MISGKEHFLKFPVRVATGFLLPGAEGGAFVMGMELVGPSKRTLAGILCWFFETSGLLITLLVAYVFGHNWRLLQVIVLEISIHKQIHFLL